MRTFINLYDIGVVECGHDPNLASYPEQILRVLDGILLDYLHSYLNSKETNVGGMSLGEECR